MNKKYKVEVNIERKKDVYLSVTHNGYQWSSIHISDPCEIPLIIDALHRHLEKIRWQKIYDTSQRI